MFQNVDVQKLNVKVFLVRHELQWEIKSIVLSKAKDYEVVNQQPSYKNESIATKAKIFTNIVAGRMTGITPFKNGNLYGSDTTPFTINPNGLINKWTGLGVAGLIYKNLPIKQLPQKSKVGTIAKGLLLGGGVGGLFDAPESMAIGSPSMTSSPQVLGRNMTVIQQNCNINFDWHGRCAG